MIALQGLAFLLLLQTVGELLTRAFRWPIPGPVIGLLLLLPALHWHAVRERVSGAADILLAHLSLLFIPVGVGVITHLELVARYGVQLLVVIVLSTWIGLAVTGFVFNALLRRDVPDAGHD